MKLRSRKPAPPLTFRRALKRTLALFLVLVVISASWVGWKVYSNASKLTGTSNPIKLLSSFTPTTLNETNGRVNILLAGYSADDPGHQGAQLTDSIMILSIDPATKASVIISVPRDLYVNIPGYGYSKINAAYEDGGMSLLESTISQDLGISFNYYALINYTAFKDAVDAVGGVTVDIESQNSAGLYDPNTNLKLANGEATLNGQTALNLARARGDGDGSYGFSNGDFDRTAHQQEILVALMHKLSSASVISNPLKIGSLADAIGNNITTDLTIGEMETLYSKLKGISDSSITSVTLNNYGGSDYLRDYTTDDGQSALVPATGIGNFSAIQSLVANLIAAKTS